MYPIATSLVFYTPYLYLLQYPPPQEHGLHIAALSNKICILDHGVASLESTIASLQRRVTSWKKRITFLKDRVSEVTSWESTIASHKGMVALLQRKTALQEKKITSLKDHVSKAVSLESMVASLQTKAALQERKITFLEVCVSHLALLSEAHKWLRNRFISTCKCDKLLKETWEDHKMIEEGNHCAHRGDIIADVKLYKGTIRRGDECDFEILYGLPLSVVANLSK